VFVLVPILQEQVCPKLFSVRPCRQLHTFCTSVLVQLWVNRSPLQVADYLQLQSYLLLLLLFRSSKIFRILWYISKFLLASPRKGKSKSVPLQAWSGPEGSRKLRFPDYMTTAQDGGKVVSLTHRPTLPSGSAPGTHFFSTLIRPQDHSAIGRIMSLKNSNDTIWNRTSDLPICNTAPEPLSYRGPLPNHVVGHFYSCYIFVWVIRFSFLKDFPITFYSHICHKYRCIIRNLI